jgi:protoporphyrinogen oxidase
MSFTRTLKLLMTSKKKRENYSMIDREVLPLYYPRDGFGAISERIAERVVSLKGGVHSALEVFETKILPGGGFVVKARDKDGKTREFEGDYLVSTIPIPDFAKTINPAPKPDVIRAAQELKYLSLMVLYLATDKTELLDCMYEYCLGRPYNRITDVNRFTLVPEEDRKGNMLSIEQSCHIGDRWWRQSKEELFKEFMPHLESEGILKESEVTGVHLVRASHAYPMYRYGYMDPYGAFKDYCDSIKNLSICGRTGAFIYMDIDQCMKLSFSLAEKIAGTALK